MANFNKVILMGNLTRDPESSFVNNDSDRAICNFGLGINRKWNDANGNTKEEATFVDCVAFGRVADIINQYCSRGNPLFVEGRLKFEQWEDKQTGDKRTKLKVIVENIQLMGSPNGNGGNGGGNQNNGNRQQNQRQQGNQRNNNQRSNNRNQRQQDDSPFGNEPQFGDDDIPF